MPPYPVQETVGCDETCRCRSAARHDPRCACGLYAIGEGCPYCTSSVAFRAKPKDETRASLMAEADARLAAAVAMVAPVNPPRQLPEGAECVPPVDADTPSESTRPAAGVGALPSSAAASADARGTSRSRGAKRRGPKTPKRSSEQVQRGAEQEAREEANREWWWSLGRVTEGQQADEEAFLAQLRDSEP